ncbi:SNF1-related protein kinase regulatory subunit gamma-like PV42a [Apium graveolens]|uniref:CBS domain-containing protein n=2 Tax=Apium graveolens TaxID=4045 RepID=A0A6L5B758_APIGR|nr:hypothetical protein AG4045_027449 [Apium graveolens]KAF1001561.1 hypothetical protein AG4045_027451 [Apium graveolens]
MQMDSGVKLRVLKVSDVMPADKRRLVEVPYTATLAHTMNALVANRVVALPVAAPPGKWIGAGGSMILEADKQTGVVRKHYIGMVTMLDILAHIAGDDGSDGFDHLEDKMSVHVSALIGQCLETLSLWTLNPTTSILDCMEVFSKGIHRALVPMDSQVENVAGVELLESASCYQMITQMDLLKFLKEKDSAELQAIMSRSVTELGAMSGHVFGVTDRTRVIDAIKSMRAASLLAVPVIEASETSDECHSTLVDGKGRKLVGTFSATDLRGCPISQLRAWLPVSVMEFTEKLSSDLPQAAGHSPDDLSRSATRELVTCYADSPLWETVDKALTKHVHRVWVVDAMGLLVGLVTLTDIIRVIRDSLLHEP